MNRSTAPIQAEKNTKVLCHGRLNLKDAGIYVCGKLKGIMECAASFYLPEYWNNSLQQALRLLAYQRRGHHLPMPEAASQCVINYIV